MPYTVGCAPAPLTLTIRPRFDWRSLLAVGWLCFVGYQAFYFHRNRSHFDDLFDIVLYALISLGVLLSLIRRERIEIYPDRIVWSKTYFGFTRSNAAPLRDVLGADWNEGEQRGRSGKGPDYVEFYLPAGSVKACYGFTFDDFDRMRQDIRGMYPELINRWGQSGVRSKNLTLLNLS